MRGRATLPSSPLRRRWPSIRTDGANVLLSASAGAAPVPLRLDAVAQAMEGRPFDETRVREAIKAALADVEVLADLHASADYRRRVAVTLAMRAIGDALTDAARRG